MTAPAPRLLGDIALLGAETGRTRAYLDRLGKAGLRLSEIILVRQASRPAAEPAATPLFDNLTPVAEAAARWSIPLVAVETADINDPAVTEAVVRQAASVLVFSGPAGAIVREPLFATGRRFLHVHPGRLPEFRGSTTIYYQLLAEGEIWASALFLRAGIDTGPVLDRARFPVPADRTSIDHAYDPFIRAELLVRVLTRYAKEGRFHESEQAEDAGATYYVIHPVLKHVALLGRRAQPSAETG